MAGLAPSTLLAGNGIERLHGDELCPRGRCPRSARRAARASRNCLNAVTCVARADGGEGVGEDDEGVENVGYLVPALLLQHVLQDWLQRDSHDRDVGGAAPASSALAAAQQQPAAADAEPSPSPSSSSPSSGEEEEEEEEGGRRGGRRASAAAAASSEPSWRGAGGGGGAAAVLSGLPMLGVRWQALESEALRKHLGLAPHESGACVRCILHLFGRLGGPEPNYRACQMSRSAKASAPKARVGATRVKHGWGLTRAGASGSRTGARATTFLWLLGHLLG